MMKINYKIINNIKTAGSKTISNFYTKVESTTNYTSRNKGNPLSCATLSQLRWDICIGATSSSEKPSLVQADVVRAVVPPLWS